jgi:hypothetical protein
VTPPVSIKRVGRVVTVQPVDVIGEAVRAGDRIGQEQLMAENFWIR